MNAPLLNMPYTERIMNNVRDTPLKRDLIECINDLPDEVLITIKPLLHMLIENTSTIESFSYEDLTEEEKTIIDEAEADFARGDFVRLEDLDPV